MKFKEEDYDRITTVLSPFNGLGSIDQEVLKNAGARGSAVHLICTNIVKNLGRFPDDSIDLVKKYSRNDEHFEKELIQINHLIDSFEIWMDERKPKKVIVPERFYNDYYMICGLPDWLYLNQSDQWVLNDWKTSGDESKTWEVQGNGYCWLAEKHGLIVDLIEFTKLDKKGKKPKNYLYDKNFGLFKGCLMTYRHFYKGFKPEIMLDYL